MKVIIEDEVLPIKIWTDDIEEGALAQAKHLAQLPFAYHHIAIMPDVHQGYGMPIGGVLATEGYVIPNAVGVDIGCGMCAIKTNTKISDISLDKIKEIMGLIRINVPVGFGKHNKPQSSDFMPVFDLANTPVVLKEYANALKSVGTLGGGNHFIELQKDKDDNLWVMIHSGSRNLGLKVADHYNKAAVELNEMWKSSVSKKWELAYLPIETEQAKMYFEEMKFCVEFALCNRQLMMNRILAIIGEYDIFSVGEMINIAHNYAVWENHFGKNVIVHRKGATLARQSIVGIIPGSQGTKSYIVEGLGNVDSFESCSHGAGRLMSRKAAIKNLDLQAEIDSLEAKGILHSIRGVKDLDEAPSSYKNIDIVMKNQEDLVKIVHTLTPIAVVKG